MPSVTEPRPNRSRRPTTVAVASLALTLLLAITLTAPSRADTPVPISVELLTGRAQFTDDVSAQFNVKLDGMGTSVLNMADPG